MDPGRGRDARWRRYPLPCDALNIEVPPSASSTWVAQYRAACSTRSDRVCIAAPRGHPRALPTRDQPFLLLRLQKRFTYHGLSTRGECMQMKTTAGPKRKYNSPSHPGMPPFKVIEIAAAAVSCAASGGLSLGSGSWTSSCATFARLGEVWHAETPPADVDRTKWDEFASKGSTLERRLLFSDIIEVAFM